jgi:glutamyl-Q tRNA(Asp) synthetase
MYRGRFAPSPTGPLHFGSLVAAVASYIDARAHGGEWLVRMEDVDEPRTMPGAADNILQTLHDFGLLWDGDVVYQSRRKPLYEAALAQLRSAGHAYGCGCTRREIADSVPGLKPGAEAPYPGTCRNGPPAGRIARSWRVRVEEDLAHSVGDFIVKRADGLFAYQLAVVVDDEDQGITDIVRGADLFTSTPRQMYLQKLLGYRTPRYAHIPVVRGPSGDKLSKQTGAAPVLATEAVQHLRAALAFLGRPVPASEPRILPWAIEQGPLRPPQYL